MDELLAIAGFGRNKPGRSLRVWLMVVALVFALISLPATRAIAAESDYTPPPGVGTLQDYMHEGEPPGQVYNPRQQNMPPEVPGPYGGPGYGPPGNYGPANGYGSPSSGQIATGAAVIGALIVAAWAYQHYQAHREEQHALRRYRRHHHGRPLPPPGPGF
jgi:hypothetical protein